MLSPSDFSYYLEPSAERVVLSSKAINQHNRDLDAYMVDNFEEEWVRNPDQEQFVFAATGRVFFRTVRGFDGTAATAPFEDGAVYMITNPDDANEIALEAVDVIHSFDLH